MFPSMRHYFDALYVTSLQHRSDRRETSEVELSARGVAEPSEFHGVHGVAESICWAPSAFKAGSGACGGLHSHIRLLQDAVIDGREQFLVLEDNASFHPRAAAMLQPLFGELPGNWDQVYLGGQHIQAPLPVDYRPGILRERLTHIARKTLSRCRRASHAPGWRAAGEVGVLEVESLDSKLIGSFPLLASRELNKADPNPPAGR